MVTPTPGTPPRVSMAAWVQTRLADFDRTSLLEKLGRLAVGAAGAGFAGQFTDQTTAWQVELEQLEHAIHELRGREPASEDWMLLLEYTIPRRQRRIDMVLLTGSMIGVFEFKIGATTFARADRWQIEDYALDLRDFHEASRGHVIVPFLIATASHALPTHSASSAGPIHLIGRSGLPDAILRAAKEASAGPAASVLDPAEWVAAPYSPVPTIVEATRTLFQQQSVRELSHAYATTSMPPSRRSQTRSAQPGHRGAPRSARRRPIVAPVRAPVGAGDGDSDVSPAVQRERTHGRVRPHGLGPSPGSGERSPS
jgi:hypothetical protein